jgi:cysteine-rich CWC protein
MVMLRKLMELIQPERRALRVCEACGNPFRCGASLKGCWCFQVKLRPGAREELRGKYKYCLCGKCLAPFTMNHAPDSDRSEASSQ